MDFFENIGAKINRAGAGASQKLKVMSAVTSLKSENSKLEKDIFELKSQLGQAYFAKYSNDAGAEFYNYISDILSCQAKIDENSKEIIRLNGVRTCSACGAEIPQDVSFCPVCGAKAEANEQAEQSQPSPNCPSCNKPLKVGAKFCTNCGYRIN